MRPIFVMLALASLPAAGCRESDSRSNLMNTSCNYPQWAQDQSYKAGDKVQFNGQAYVAEHDNPGYDPSISTWYWEPTQCSDDSTANCGSVQPWRAGVHYETGVLVSTNEKIYKATHSNPGYDPVISFWYWQEVEDCADQQDAPNPGQSAGDFRSIMSEAMFNSMFPNRLTFYAYEDLVSAVDSYPGFAKEGSDEIRKREVAAFLANIEHESGHLQHIEESNKTNWPHYCDQSNTIWPCSPGKQYYGRGPIQISWNYNYGAASQAIGVDILANPDLVAQDPKIAWQTAIWFWMTQTGAGTMTSHNAIINGAGFGETIRTINGALECNGRNPAQVQARIDYFRRMTKILSVSVGDTLGC